MPPPALPAAVLDVSASRCAIYSFDLVQATLADPKGVWRTKARHHFATLSSASERASFRIDKHAADLSSGERRWLTDQYSAELWLQRALSTHPWRAASPESADVHFAGANVSLMAETGVAGGLIAVRDAFHKLLLAQDTAYASRSGSRGGGATGTASGAGSAGGRTAPVIGDVNRTLFGPFEPKPTILVLTSSKTAVATSRNLGPPRRAILLVDTTRRIKLPYDGQAAVLPYVLSRPELRPSGSGATLPRLLAEIVAALPPWQQRKLLFFVGHVPKVTISPVRFLIWQQIYAAPDVTTRSHTLHCTVGQFEICATPSRIATHFLDYCHAPCYDDEKAFIKYTDGTRRPPPCRHRNGNALRDDCKTHSRLGIRFTPQLVGALNASRRTNQQRRFTPYPQYVAEAMHHRFCLVAAGDFPGTPKLADFAIFGAAGGCIPLVVIKSEASEQRNPTLPWRRWIDWCDISYLTTEKVVHAGNFTRVLEQLRGVDESEIAAKHAALARVRNAFYWQDTDHHRGGGIPPSTAVDFALAEACEIGRSLRRGEDGRPPFKSSLSRCILGT